MSEHTILQATQAEILAGLDKASSEYQIAALTKKKDDQRILFDVVESSKEIEMQYAPTVLSPKKFFFPQEEVFLEYTADGTIAPAIEADPLVLFGLHPCEAHALQIMDEAFAESHGDPNYLAKREQAVVICLDCKEVCDDNAFCYRVNSNYADEGFDLMLHELNGAYAITVKTDKGQKFVDTYIATQAVDQAAFDKFQQAKQEAFRPYAAFNGLDKLPEIFEANKEHPIWKQEGDRCLSCGSCIMVCPTCYCFDVADELKLNLQQGQRIRRWDACMLSAFARVAGGENFREEVEERLKHRIYRKFDYLMAKHEQAVCVGCGRCVRACLAEISPKTIVEAITGEPA
ncbi:Ni/Fe hydrogenase subunit beta [candidate division KSB3 bacterium]|uniref:Ni/Fe hydrogenase subunit beta n=1 Tax=candidate division KSB3 bacterium TaxID=2044937 RepID=A0A9D5Q7U4_9BACT|nr:Ni/Fe hydrogenase subunit beta [candidate division KSB3 bacterium]MBD3326667.1 Ni/Fe hydrogenase subunit beta [candidate division KSB3 bacterium]